MSYEKLLAEIEGGQLNALYGLHGEEPYFIDKIAEAIQKKSLEDHERDFNESIFYGKDADARSVVDTCRQFPMMASRRLVMIKEAQQMRDLSALVDYVKNPAATTVLVICHKYKKLDGRTQFAKAIKQKGIVFESKKLYDNQLEPWIHTALIRKGVKSAPGVVGTLAQYLGNDLQKIENEIEKIVINKKKGEEVTTDDVEKYVGISKQYNVFELQRVMGRGDLQGTMRMVNYFAEGKSGEAIAVIATLYGYFTRLLLTGVYSKLSDKDLQYKLGLSSTYFVKEYRSAIRFFNGKRVMKAFRLLAEYDLRVKGVNNKSTPPGELLREMMLRMMA